MCCIVLSSLFAKIAGLFVSTLFYTPPPPEFARAQRRASVYYYHIIVTVAQGKAAINTTVVWDTP